MNDRETMQATAADFVSYYERILDGDFIRTDAMRTEFRRISSMANALWQVVPRDTPAYGKGGSIEWNDFNCYCLPGQMRLGGVIPVTFSFCVNWPGSPDTIPVVAGKFAATIRDALAETAKAFG
jgi:beta-lactamase class A